jgi:hypothetical protein
MCGVENRWNREWSEVNWRDDWNGEECIGLESGMDLRVDWRRQ